MDDEFPEFALFPEPSVSRVHDAAKSLLLFFDGVAMFVPNQERIEYYKREDAYSGENLMQSLVERDVLQFVAGQDLVDDQIVDSVLELIQRLPDEEPDRHMNHVLKLYREEDQSRERPRLY